MNTVGKQEKLTKDSLRTNANGEHSVLCVRSMSEWGL